LLNSVAGENASCFNFLGGLGEITRKVTIKNRVGSKEMKKKCEPVTPSEQKLSGPRHRPSLGGAVENEVVVARIREEVKFLRRGPE